MPKKNITPRYKFKKIKKGGKVQKIQSTGVHKMKFNLLTEMRGSIGQSNYVMLIM